MVMVSIIIPVYNAEKYMKSCLESLIHQTYQHFELILVDDGSNDASGMICDNYAKNDQRITVYHRENSGVSASRNYGLERAKGKYILFVDADDSIEPNMIEGCIRLAEDNDAELVICGFRYHMIDENRIVENCLRYDFYGTEEELFEQWFTVLMEKEILNPPWNKFVRKDLIDSNQIRFHEKYSICEDMAFSIQLLAASKKTIITSQMFYNYNIKSSGTLVFKLHENYFDALSYFYELACDYCGKFKNNRKQLKRLNHLYMQHIIFFLDQIYAKSLWDKKLKFAKMNEIARNKDFLHAYRNAGLDGKKKLVCFFLAWRQFYLIHILFLLKSIKNRKRIK